MGTRSKVAAQQAEDANVEVRTFTFKQQQEIFRLQAEARQQEHELLQQKAQEAANSRGEQYRIIQAQIELARLQNEGAAVAAAAAAAAVRPDVGVNVFRVNEAVCLLPPFDDRDIDLYFSNFEKITMSRRWPREHWSSVLTPMLKGSKALRALNRLTVAQISDYNEFKQAVLNEYNMVPEVYRNKFRACVKRNGDSYADFSQFLTSQFERWITSMHAVDDFEGLKQMLLIEQFMNKVPDEVKQFLVDKNCGTLHECARRADEYAAVHKSMRLQQPKSQQFPSSKLIVNTNSKYEQKRSDNMQNNHNTTYSNRFNSEKTHIICYNCNKPGHVKKDCPHKSFDTKGIKLVQNVNDDVHELCQIEIIKRSNGCCDNFVPYTDDSSQFVFPVCFYNSKDDKCVTVKGYRDSGTAVTLLMEGAEPDEFLSPPNDTVWLEFANG